MLPSWIIILFSLVYISILFAIAYYGDKGNYAKRLRPYRGIIYSLSLAVYCTSWTYYGAVGSAATNGWRYIAIYLGPMLLIFFGYRFLKKIATICSEQNITSIADFISSRYGKSSQLAVLVTLIAITGTLPYIALQLKAIASSYGVLTASLSPGEVAAFGNAASDTVATLLSVHGEFTGPSLWGDTAFIVALVMAVFSILFGTRYVHASEHHEGLILAIAFESIVKLFALTLVALLALFVLFNAPDVEWNRLQGNDPQAAKLLTYSLPAEMLKLTFLSHTVLALAAIFCLPRQFHVSFVEVTHPGDMRKARWVFPLYLLLTTLVVIPITLAGSMVNTRTGMNVAAIAPDMFVLTLPIIEQSGVLTLLAFIGGFSAATGMIIVAVITLSTMVCNDIVMPLLFRVRSLELRQKADLTRLLLLIRRVAIILILILSYFYYRYIGDEEALASIGLTAFVAAIQFAPAIVGAVYWKQATGRGATAGLLVGFAVWLYTLFLPGLLGSESSFVANGPWGISWLRPSHLLGVETLEPVTHSLVFSLGLNILCFLLFSLQRKPQLLERMQAANFTHTVHAGMMTQGLPWWSTAEVGELRLLAEKFVGKNATRQAFADFTTARRGELVPSEKADAELVNFTEHLLAGAIGSSSARVMINSVLNKKKDLPLEDVFNIVDETSQALQFSQSLLHATIEHLDQGVSVVDKNLNLVAWNSRYLEIYDYPAGMVKVGRPIAEIIRHNALAGECGPGEVDEHVEKRLNHMRAGTVHAFERYRPDGTVLQIQGRPLPRGGFVTTFTDITAFKNAERELRDINENLEQMVGDRTLELSQVNEQLQQANRSKSRFLAAVNHDVMQPLNAARLFTSALEESPDDRLLLTERITSSLRSAEEIIQTLIAISKLDSGAVRANITTFNINKVLSTLQKEFEVIAANKQIGFKLLPCQVMVTSDAHLLRRILQNFIANALRYTPQGGRVTVGCRRIGWTCTAPQLKICTFDTGSGIAESDQAVIFEEFRQLDNQQSEETKGIGLGLSIAKRLGQILDHPLTLQSEPGRGSMFAVTVPVSLATSESAVEEKLPLEPASLPLPIAGLKVLCIDNEKDILDAMTALLERWSCRTFCAPDAQTALADMAAQDYRPDIMLVDYHLNKREKGLDVMDRLRSELGQAIPGVLITADVDEALMAEARVRGYKYLRKPVNPVLLRKVLVKVVQGEVK